MANFNKIKQLIFHYLSLDFLKKETYPIQFDDYFLQQNIENMPQMVRLRYYQEDSCSPIKDINELLRQSKNLYQEMIYPSKEQLKQKQNVLQKIWTDCYHIHLILEPLRKLNINYNLDVVGGAIRDLLLNNEENISDLDILISFKNNHSKQKHDNDHMNKIKTVFSSEEIQQFQLSIHDNLVDVQNKLVAMCFNRFPLKQHYQQFSEEERFIFSNIDGYGSDLLEHVSSFIQLEGKHYPIDVLVTPYSRESFFNSYDFDICRVGLCLTNNSIANHQKNRINFPHSYKELYSRIYTTTHFLNDVYHQTITYDPKEKSEQQLITSFNKRYYKILQKYPNYQFQINDYVTSEEYTKINSSLKEFNLSHYHMAKTILFNHQLDYTLLSNNNVVIPRNKI